MRLPQIPFGSRSLKKQRPLLKGSDVRKLQQILKQLGLLSGKVDGIFGNDTARSVKNFQKAFGKKPNGIVDDWGFLTLKELYKVGAGRWLTIQRDSNHTGYSPIPLSNNLKIVHTKKISDIISFNFNYDRLVVTTKHGIYVLDEKGEEIFWNNNQITPMAHATISSSHVIVPAGSLIIFDIYSGDMQCSIDMDNFLTPVAASDGVIYAVSNNGFLYAFNYNGNLVWKYKTSTLLYSPPTTAFDLIYFSSYDEHIYCIDRQGIPYWKTRVFDVIKNPVSIWNQRVYAISQDSWFLSANPLSGEIIWKKKFSNEQFLLPAFHKEFMLAANVKGDVYALNLQNGKIKWVKDLKDIITTSPLICVNTAFFGTEKGLVALDLKTGNSKSYLQGKNITALAQIHFNLYVTTEKELVIFSPIL